MTVTGTIGGEIDLKMVTVGFTGISPTEFAASLGACTQAGIASGTVELIVEVVQLSKYVETAGSNTGITIRNTKTEISNEYNRWMRETISDSLGLRDF